MLKKTLQEYEEHIKKVQDLRKIYSYLKDVSYSAEFKTEDILSMINLMHSIIQNEVWGLYE